MILAICDIILSEVNCRVSRLLETSSQQATERRKLPHGVGLSFEPASSRVTELANLVDLERECCPFLNFRIEVRAGGAVWPELTSPAAVQEIFIRGVVSSD
jgi:hypothetical protein